MWSPRVYSVPKVPDEAELNEDAWDQNVEWQRLALSDGASESFDSRSWAQLLVKVAVATPLERDDALTSIVTRAVEEYASLYDPSELSWSRRLAYERGSFATLLACQLHESRRTLELICVGDSIGLLLSEQCVVDSFAYQTLAQFAERPLLLCTQSDLNAEVLATDFTAIRKTIDLDLGSISRVLLMTDALGAWALQRMEEGCHDEVLALADFEDHEAFSDFVAAERYAGRLRVDDTTLAVIELTLD